MSEAAQIAEVSQADGLDHRACEKINSNFRRLISGASNDQTKITITAANQKFSDIERTIDGVKDTAEEALRIARLNAKDIKDLKEKLADDIWKIVYPIGALYASYESTSPALLFGGSWVQITGRFLRAANDRTTGGSDSIALSVSQMPNHDHKEHKGNMFWTGGKPGNCNTTSGTDMGAYDYRPDAWTDSAGDGQAFSNMPAYQDIYVWRRTA